MIGEPKGPNAANYAHGGFPLSCKKRPFTLSELFFLPALNFS